MEISLVIGLGNPGRQYEGTRHNIGFMLLDKMAAGDGAVFKSEPKFQAHFTKLSDGTVLMKPQTFMNLSGRSVRQFLSFFKMDLERVLVVYDDVALPLGHLRFREKGSAGGHNGIKSLIEHLGGDGFPRLKMGIGGARPGEMTGHVLGKFAPDEREDLENMLATAVEAVQFSRSQGIALASNRFNTPKTKPTPTKEDEPQIRRSDCTDNEEPRR
ncbi:MAG: aminoacyl-tRNA hydrolase [Verrucomicrobia bacterium]|jgi:PTH1 family peptidyl-tRNA hydrolase|nr:aminoacyl-tRNA hydrolase [Verrucomicrobiota bacterium]|tara:strand:- start:1275 stop:1916 length:642 start_codon:yes stop_codon:yes gene_type:complete